MADNGVHAAGSRLSAGMVLVRPVRDTQAETFSQEFIAGLDQSIGAAGGTILVTVVSDEQSERAIYRHWAESGTIDTVVIEDFTTADTRLALLDELGLDVMVTGDLDLAGERSAIWTDHAKAMRLAVVALHDLGHRVIARVSGPTHFRHSVARSAAFFEATAELGMFPSEALGDYSQQSGYAATQSLLDAAEPPTAIIYDNDLMALGGLEQASESGRAVPGDLSIVAWDDSVRCQMSDPPLAALSHDVRQIGQMVGNAISETRAGHIVREETPPPTLVLRGSVGRLDAART
jgi:DNA-binding LacI/PurR family transcriptional regulator